MTVVDVIVDSPFLSDFILVVFCHFDEQVEKICFDNIYNDIVAGRKKNFEGKQTI